MFFSRFVHAGVCSFVTDTDVEPDDVRTESNVNVQAECLAVSRHAEDLSITVHVLGDVCFVCFTSVRLVVFCRVPTWMFINITVHVRQQLSSFTIPTCRGGSCGASTLPPPPNNPGFAPAYQWVEYGIVTIIVAFIIIIIFLLLLYVFDRNFGTPSSTHGVWQHGWRASARLSSDPSRRRGQLTPTTKLFSVVWTTWTPTTLRTTSWYSSCMMTSENGMSLSYTAGRTSRRLYVDLPTFSDAVRTSDVKRRRLRP